jgi:hypothetical protein
MKKIFFYPKDKKTEKIGIKPEAAFKNFPIWFKDLKPFISKSSRIFIDKNHNFNLTAKACAPTLDILSSGYYIYLESDIIAVKPEDYECRIAWEDSSTIFVTEHTKNQVGEKFTVPFGYETRILKWENFWNIKTPPGYSLLFIHPSYRFDLPFYSFPAIVDTDSYNIPVNIPFVLRKNFYGKIPKGTPICQVIPIKKENWISEIKNYDDEMFSFENNLSKLKRNIVGSYKKNFWNKKTYK